MGVGEVGQFLDHLAQTESDPVRALAASRDAIALLYRDVLHIEKRGKKTGKKRKNGKNGDIPNSVRLNCCWQAM